MAVIAPFTFTRTPSGTIIVPFTFPHSQLDSQWYHHCSLYLSSFTAGLPVVPSLFPLPFLVHNWTPSGTDIVPFTFPRSQLDSQWYCHCSLYCGSPTPVLICQ